MKKMVYGTWGAALLITATLILATSAGCGQIATERAYWGETFDKALFHETNTTQTVADRMHTHRQVINQDARAIVDDIDFILMRERPSRLSRWHDR